MKVGTLLDLAAIDGMPSEPTLRRFIAARPDFPLIRAGRPGVPYQIDLDQAATFVATAWRDPRRRAPIEAMEPAPPSGAGLAVEVQPVPGATLGELAALDGMPSLPSLQRFIATHPDFPVIERGGYGRPYRLDLAAAAQFIRDNWRDGRRRSAADTSCPPAQECLPGLFDIDDTDGVHGRLSRA